MKIRNVLFALATLLLVASAQAQTLDELHKKPFQKESLALNPHHGVQQRLEYIGDHLATSRLGNDPSSQLVGCGIDVIDFDAWKSFFEGRKNR